MKQIKPVEHAINVFGGLRAMSRAIGRSPSSICRWRKPRKERGSDGFIPAPVQRIILERARRLKLDITPEDLINGRRL